MVLLPNNRGRRAVQDAFDSYARYWIDTFRLPTLSKQVVADGSLELSRPRV